jgi:hypothetical protein
MPAFPGNALAVAVMSTTIVMIACAVEAPLARVLQGRSAWTATVIEKFVTR